MDLLSGTTVRAAVKAAIVVLVLHLVSGLVVRGGIGAIREETAAGDNELFEAMACERNSALYAVCF